jgi:hypothetical protein
VVTRRRAAANDKTAEVIAVIEPGQGWFASGAHKVCSAPPEYFGILVAGCEKAKTKKKVASPTK